MARIKIPVFAFKARFKSLNNALGDRTLSHRLSAATTSKPSSLTSPPRALVSRTTFSTVSLSKTTSKPFSLNLDAIPGELSVAHVPANLLASVRVTSPSPAPTSKNHPPPAPSPHARINVSTCASLNTNIFPRPKIAFASVNDIVRRSSVHFLANRSHSSRPRARALFRNSTLSESRDNRTNFSLSAEDARESTSASYGSARSSNTASQCAQRILNALVRSSLAIALVAVPARARVGSFDRARRTGPGATARDEVERSEGAKRIELTPENHSRA